MGKRRGQFFLLRSVLQDRAVTQRFITRLESAFGAGEFFQRFVISDIHAVVNDLSRPGGSALEGRAGPVSAGLDACLFCCGQLLSTPGAKDRAGDGFLFTL